MSTTTYTHTTSATTRMNMLAVATQPVTGPTLLAAAFGGSLVFHKVRSNGTLRRWPVLEPGSKARKQAEAWVGQPVAAAAKASHTSTATVRRALVALAFTQELENSSKAALATLAKAATANGKVHVEQAPKQEQEPAKPAPKPAAPKAAKAGKPVPAKAAKAATAPKA